MAARACSPLDMQIDFQTTYNKVKYRPCLEQKWFKARTFNVVGLNWWGSSQVGYVYGNIGVACCV